MLVDLSVKVSKAASGNALDNEKMVSFGHLGTHFDVMNKEFPLEFVKREGLVFNVREMKDREILSGDIDMSLVKENMFVAFYTGFIEDEGYGTKKYFTEHPELSNELIDLLLDKKVSIIGIDFAGVRRGAEHTPKDQYCADRGVFIIENLCNLDKVLNGKKHEFFVVNTYPVNFGGMSGLPCRVVGEI
ncbi:cyclase family protein [Sebaldella sp. S0638]|uniref:cyclase family protein n=1 Tax=Sebaldella sp. S0638 TaxID=2957809 RepID=UPI0020A08DB3|nr:cyclase family protein [Sebaldella sp. S0638]MCP1225640.1 cyclase family protein [Sebaldella sp. S0638]